MNNYYVSIIVIVSFMMITNIVHLFESSTLERRVKNRFILITVLIMLGAICEFLGLYLNGSDVNLIFLHAFIKSIEYSIPTLILAIYTQIIRKVDTENLIKKVDVYFLSFINFIAEILSIFFPITFYIDSQNIYRHANFYCLYIVSYVLGLICFIFYLVKSTKKYQGRNIVTLISMLAFLLVGISIKLVDSNIYLDWLVVAIAFMIFMIYYSDLSLKVDSMTGLLNRRSYENKISSIDYDTGIILLDVNSFKRINDIYGHQSGDKALKIIANNILKNYSKYGYCYRIGGDEFCIILKRGKVKMITDENITIEDFLKNLNKKFDNLIFKESEKFSMLKQGVSKGFSVFHPQGGKMGDAEKEINETIKIADQYMYKEKNST